MKMKNKLLLLAMGIALSAQTLIAQVPSYVPTDGLVGYWPFSGNANDDSGNGNNGTLNGATLTTDRFGNSNSAYNFDGLNDFISVNPSPSLNIVNNISISLWFYTTQTGFYGYLVDRDICGISKDWSLAYNGTSILRIGNGSTDQIINSGSNNINSWHNLVFVRMNDSFKLYIDGTFSSELPISGLNFQNNQTPIYFGEQVCLPNSVNSPNFNGKIDDIGIWNRALTQQEITTMYNSVEVPTYSDTCNNVSGSLTQGLVGYWPFCGNANDDSGNGNNGTVNGATLTNDRFGNANSAYNFNGTNNFIELVNSAQLDNMNDFSISTWYQVNNTSPQFQFLVSKDLMGDPPNGDWDFYVNYNKVKFDITINTNNNSGTQSSLILPNTWNHALITRNSSSGLINIYINGILENSFTGYIGPYSNTQKMNFGRQGSSNQHFLNGKLDDIGIWNRALTPSEVTQLFNQNQCFTNTTVTDTLIINVGQLSYTNPIAYANNIIIAPNPASTQININFNNITNLNGGTLKIINSLGQEVATTPITTSGTNSTMQLATWGGTGMYFVQIINPQGQIVDIKKIILQ